MKLQLFLIPILLLSIVIAQSAGVSPSTLEACIKPNTVTELRGFMVSQASDYIEAMTVTTEATWLILSPNSFNLESRTGQKVKATVQALPEGFYETKVSITGIPIVDMMGNFKSSGSAGAIVKITVAVDCNAVGVVNNYQVDDPIKEKLKAEEKPKELLVMQNAPVSGGLDFSNLGIPILVVVFFGRCIYYVKENDIELGDLLGGGDDW